MIDAGKRADPVVSTVCLGQNASIHPANGMAWIALDLGSDLVVRPAGEVLRSSFQDEVRDQKIVDSGPPRGRGESLERRAHLWIMNRAVGAVTGTGLVQEQLVHVALALHARRVQTVRFSDGDFFFGRSAANLGRDHARQCVRGEWKTASPDATPDERLFGVGAKLFGRALHSSGDGWTARFLDDLAVFARVPIPEMVPPRKRCRPRVDRVFGKPREHHHEAITEVAISFDVVPLFAIV